MVDLVESSIVRLLGRSKISIRLFPNIQVGFDKLQGRIAVFALEVFPSQDAVFHPSNKIIIVEL